MDRRTFIGSAAGGLLGAPLAVKAQRQGTAARIGYLRRTSREPADLEALRLGLRELGYIEGQNLIIDERYANGDASRLAGLALELVQLKVQVLVVDGGVTVRAAREVAAATPIVFTVVGDPVAAGFVNSLDHPGGTLTGLTNFGTELVQKRLQLLREILPARRVGVLSNPTNTSQRAMENLLDAARALGLELVLVDARSPDELAGAFAKLSQAGVTAVLMWTDAMFLSQRARVTDLAIRHRLPTVYQEREFTDAGGLMSYGPNEPAIFRQAAAYVDKILKGAKPADLPIQQPVRIELVINLKTAKALGITIPQSLLLRADEVIR